jgi:Ca-activated chloride channel family protein
MTFLRSWALFVLVVVPLAIVVYVWLARRKRKFAVRYASLSLIREARPGRLRWRRHAPFALLLASVAALVLALGRPQMTIPVSRSSTSIILTLDVSRSMCSTDITPNRLTVAQDAARTFIKDQPQGVRIGVIAFAGSAQLLVPPTTDTAKLLRAIGGLTTSVGTAIGSAVLTSIDALAGVNPEVAPSTVDLGGKNPTKPSPGSAGYVPDIVVLLTDGDSNRGVDPLVAAGQAADRRVRVYTIGFGTDTPGASVCSPQQIGAGSAGNFGGGFQRPGGGNPRQSQAIDETTLTAIADTTGGKYFRAQNARQLQQVFRDLPSRVQVQQESHEDHADLVGLGALLATLAVGLSLWWNRYP